MESEILGVLEFNLTAPTPYEFHRRFTEAAVMIPRGQHLTMVRALDSTLDHGRSWYPRAMWLCSI